MYLYSGMLFVTIHFSKSFERKRSFERKEGINLLFFLGGA
jgi:hypothetical protein